GESGGAGGGLRKLARQYIDFNCPGDGVLGSIIEQEPNRDSRVTLADDIDSLGLRRVQLNWQFCTNDLQTIRTMSVELAKEMARLTVARVQLSPFILDTQLEIPASGFAHRMRTTLMPAEPRT